MKTDIARENTPMSEDAPGRRRLVAISYRPAALAFRLIALVLAVTGVVRIAGLLTGAPEWSAFLFYTVLSNVLCIVWLVMLIVKTITDLRRYGVRGVSTPSPRLSGAVMMAITVTMVIYLVVLLPAAFQQAGDYEPFSFTDTLIHVLTPCLLILDWLLFVGKGFFRWIDPLLWALLPYTYLVFAFTYGAFGGEFYPGKTSPYPFMDVGTLDIGGVAMWLFGLTAGLVAIGYLFVLVDRLLARFGSVPGNVRARR